VKALLLIDIQNDYFPGGAAEIVGPLEAAQCAAHALRLFRDEGLPVIHVQHANTRPGATYLLPGTPGGDIHQSVAPLPGEPVVIKHTPNSFHDTTLDELIARLGVDHLVVCGMMTHMCVDTTVRAAKDRQLPVTLLHDACATKDLAFGGVTVPASQVQASFVAALQGMFADVIATADLNAS